MKRALLPIILCLTAASAWTQTTTPGAAPAPKRFLIEREIPGASQMTPEQMREGAAKSNKVLRDLGTDIQWVHSYVAGDKIYCVYTAPSEELIRQHAQLSGFPADKITPVAAVLDPTTAGSKR
ncbi:MAG: DUF4242 domain-containing protein [Burkholderiaceae bacterium]